MLFKIIFSRFYYYNITINFIKFAECLGIKSVSRVKLTNHLLKNCEKGN